MRFTNSAGRKKRMGFMKWRCKVCNWIYDEEKEGIKFKDLPEDWKCPVCGVKKSRFEKVVEGTRKSTVADKIIEQLAAVGVKYIYGIPGDSNLPLIEALRNQNKIKFVLTRHEETAAFMASAHGKLTGELGVCISIAGPGTTNLLTGLMDAATDGAPVLALTGQVSQMRLGSEGFQEINQIELFRSFAVFTETITSPTQAVRLTMMAVKRAYSRRGVAHLSLPTDVLMEPLNEKIWNPKEHIFKRYPEPSEGDIRMAAKLINRSKKPMILGGWGIRNAGREVIALAEKISSPIATTSRSKGAIPENHRLAVGVLGAIGTPYAAKAAKNADLLIVLGSAFRQRNLVPEVPIIQVDINGFRVGREFPVNVGVVGDVTLVVQKLVKAVKKKMRDREYFREIREIRTAHRKEIENDAKNTSMPIYPGYVIQAIKRYADKNALICVDVGDHTYWFYRKYVCAGEETLISANLASMAFALPASLSGQLIYPERQVICVTGDGGFAMLMADFTTAVFNSLPIKVIVFNDGRLKNIKKEQEMFGYAEFGTDFVNPNFAEFAKSCGGEGYRVEKPEELDSALKKAFKSRKPGIVDVVVDPNKMTPITLMAPEG